MNHSYISYALLAAAMGCLASTSANAFVGVGGAVDAVATAAVAGYGVQAATTATDDDD